MAKRTKAPDFGPYLLRGVGADRVSHSGFQYPDEGWAEASDFSPAAVCGGGLHGLLAGLGDSSLVKRDGLGQVLCACEDVVSIDGGAKVKCRRAYVRTFPTIQDAANWLRDRVSGAVHFSTSTSGDRGTSTSGYGGTSTSGNGGTSTSGDRGTSTSGYGGTSTSGDRGTSTSGDWGTSTSGNGGTSTSGDRGTSTSGDRGTSTSGNVGTSTSGDGGTSTSGYGGTSTSGYGGTSTSGDGGTSTSGNGGTSTSGYGGTSTSGNGGTATAGVGGLIALLWWDGRMYRMRAAEVDGETIKAGVAYRLDADGHFVAVEEVA